MESLHLEIHGRVQGVGFRWFVRERGRALRLSGWVKNRPDGKVEVAAGGPLDALEKLRADLAKGPPGARVEQLRELDPIEPESLDSPFAIDR
jgi:acylphosphatase